MLVMLPYVCMLNYLVSTKNRATGIWFDENANGREGRPIHEDLC